MKKTFEEWSAERRRIAQGVDGVQNTLPGASNRGIATGASRPRNDAVGGQTDGVNMRNDSTNEGGVITSAFAPQAAHATEGGGRASTTWSGKESFEEWSARKHGRVATISHKGFQNAMQETNDILKQTVPGSAENIAVKEHQNRLGGMYQDYIVAETKGLQDQYFERQRAEQSYERKIKELLSAEHGQEMKGKADAASARIDAHSTEDAAAYSRAISELEAFERDINNFVDSENGYTVKPELSKKYEELKAAVKANDLELQRDNAKGEYKKWVDLVFSTDAEARNALEEYIKGRTDGNILKLGENPSVNRTVTSTDINSVSKNINDARTDSAKNKLMERFGISESELEEIYDDYKMSGLDTAGYLSGKFLSGAYGAVQNATQFLNAGFWDIAANTAYAFGFNKAGAAMEKWSKGSFDGDIFKAEAFAKWVEDGYSDKIKGKFTEFAGGISESAGAMLPAIAAGNIAGMAGAGAGVAEATNFIMFGSSAAGGAAKEALDAGASFDEAFQYGVYSGMLEVFTEKMFAGIAGMNESGLLDEVIDKLGKNGTMRLLADIFGEGVEEVVSAYLTPYIKRAIYDPDAARATIDELLESFASGAALSVIMEGVGSIGNGGLNGMTADIPTMEDTAMLRWDKSGRADIAEMPTSDGKDWLNGIGVTTENTALRQAAEEMYGVGAERGAEPQNTGFFANAQNDSLNEKAASGETANKSGNIRLTNADVDEYVRVGKREHVRNLKTDLVNSGENPILTTKEKIKDFIRKAISGELGQTIRAYGKIGQSMADDIKNVAEKSGIELDVSGYYLELEASHLDHITDHIGEDTDPRNVPLTPEQAENIPDYIDNYDDILEVEKKKDGSIRIVIGKKINGHAVIVETVSKGRLSLAPRTAWVNRTDVYIEKYHKKVDASATEKTASAISGQGTGASNNNIPQTDPTVNGIVLPKAGEGDVLPRAEEHNGVPTSNDGILRSRSLPQNDSVEEARLPRNDAGEGQVDGVGDAQNDGINARNNSANAIAETHTGLYTGNEAYKKAKLSSADARKMNALGKLTGVQIRFAEANDPIFGGKDVNAAYDSENKRIVISLEAENPFVTATIHENVHRLKEISPEFFDELEFIVLKYLNKSSALRSLDIRYAAYADKIAGMSEKEAFDYISEETVADAVSYLLSDAKVMENIAAEHRGVIQALRDLLHDIWVKIQKIINGEKSRTLSASQRAEFRELGDNIYKLEAVFKKALESAEAVNKAAATENGILRSARNDSVEEARLTQNDSVGETEESSAGSKVRYSLIGKNSDGIEIYETSEEVRQMSYKQRMDTFMDIMRNEYRGRTAKFTANGEVYYAKFDDPDILKNVYGDKKSSSRGWRAKINTGADGNIFELVENSQYVRSSTERGKTTEAHKNLTGWEYFVKTVQIDGQVYDLLANVRKKPDGEYVYSIQLNENKNKTPAPPLAPAYADKNKPVGYAQNRVPTDVSNNSIPQNGEKSNTEFSVSEGNFVTDDVIAQGGQGRLSGASDAHTSQSNSSAPHNDSAKEKSKIRYSYAGIKAKRADMRALKKAKAMKANGIAAEKIFRDTGWYTGADGKWRFEIDDSKMEVNIPITLKKALGEYIDSLRALERKGMTEEQNKEVGKYISQVEHGQDSTELYTKLYDELGRDFDTLAKSVEAYEKSRYYGNKAILKDSITHDELFENYPWLEDVKLRFKDMRESGMYDAEERTIILNESLRDDPKDALIHEIQHAIQQKEGFASGSSPEYWQYQKSIEENTGNGYSAEELYYNTAGEIEARDAERRRTLTTAERRERMPDTGNENTVFADYSMAGYMMSKEESLSVKEQLRRHQDELNKMKTVVDLNSNGWKNMSVGNFRKKIVSELKNTGYRIDRQGFGTIEFTEKELNTSLNYITTDAEAATYSAIPQILKRGIEISGHVDHKGRGYDTVTFAAPINLNGKRGNMAVVVKQTKGNRYKVHRILTPEGNTFILPEKANAVSTSAGGFTEDAQSSGAVTPTINTAFNNSISQNGEKSNSENRQSRKYYDLIDQYGAFEQGENAAREVEVPRRSGDIRYYVKYDVNNRPFVEVENDILAGVPRSEWVKTVKDNLRKKFPDGITVGNSEIKINAQSRREMTFSNYMQQIFKNEPQIFADKLRATDNADDILRASQNWVNEALLHPRKDAVIDFARGEVLLRVGDFDYTAQVVVANRGNRNLTLYDIINMERTTIRERKKTDTTYTTNTQKEPRGRQVVSVEERSQTRQTAYPSPSTGRNTLNDSSNNSIPQNGEKSNSENRQSRKYYDLIDQYGAFEKGENAAREVEVPRRSGEREYVRKFIRTAMEASSTNDDMLGIYKERIENGAFSYHRISDKETIAKAEELIVNDYEKAVKIWDGVVAGNKTATKQDIAIGEALYIQAAQKGDYGTAMRIMAELAAEGTRAGQTVQALHMLKKMPGVAQVYYIQQTIDNLQKDLDKRYGSKAPRIHISDELISELETAQGEKAVDAVIDKILTEAAGQMPVSWADKWNAWRYISMLANPRTHIRNIVGNAFFAPAVKLKNTIALPLERIFIKNGEKSKALKVGREYKDFAENDWLEMAETVGGGGKHNPADIVRDKRTIFKTKALEKIRVINSELLEREDRLFLKRYYVSAMGQYLQANKLDPGTMSDRQLENARAYALSEAQKATYRDYSAVATKIAQLGKGSKPAEIFVEGILPFKKTPINVLKRGIEYSPIGLVNAITRGSYQLKTGKITAAEYIDKIAAGFTGLGVMLLGMLLSDLGILVGKTGGGKDDEFEKTQGLQGYALKFGDTTYTLDWAAPISMPLFIGVELMGLVEGENEDMQLKDVIEAMSGITEPMFSMSMLDGMNSLIDSVSYAEGSEKLTALGTGVLESYAGQAVPTVFGQVARTVDGTRRRNYTDNNSALPGDAQYFINKQKNKIPGLSFTSEPYVDVWGREDKEGNPLVRAVENFASPGYMSKYETSPMEEELKRVYNMTGEDVFPKVMGKKITVDGEDKYLTAKEYTQYQKSAGQTAYNELTAITASKAYAALTDREKAKVIDKARTYAVQLAKSGVSDYTPDEWVTRAEKMSQKERIDFIVSKVLLSESEAIKDGNGNVVMEKSTQFIEKLDRLDLSDREYWEQYAEAYSGIATRTVTDDNGDKQKVAVNPADLGLSCKEYIKLYDEYGSTMESKKIYTAYGYGVDLGLFLRANEVYNSIKTEDGGASRSELFADYVDSLALSDEEKYWLYKTEYENDKSNPWKWVGLYGAG